MHSVLDALKMRYKKFLGILMLLLIILNFYSFAGYSWFDTRFKARVRYDKPDGEDYFIEEYLCETPLHCILSLLQHGLRES